MLTLCLQGGDTVTSTGQGAGDTVEGIGKSAGDMVPGKWAGSATRGVTKG